jgi:hypothetical protein
MGCEEVEVLELDTIAWYLPSNTPGQSNFTG